MKEIKKHLGEIEKEIIEGKKLVREKKRAARKAGTFLERDNKARAMTTAAQGVEELKDQREALEDAEVKKSSSGNKRRRGSQNKRRGARAKKRRVKRASP